MSKIKEGGVEVKTKALFLMASLMFWTIPFLGLASSELSQFRGGQSQESVSFSGVLDQVGGKFYETLTASSSSLIIQQVLSVNTTSYLVCVLLSCKCTPILYVYSSLLP